MKKNKPEIRFKGFEGNWEEVSLEDLAFFNPKSDLPNSFEYVDLESVIGTEMISHRTENLITAPSRAQRLAKKGDLFYQTVRPYQKNNYLFLLDSQNFVFSTGYAQLRPYNDGHFLLSLVQKDDFVKVVLENCTGTSYPAINSSKLSEIKVFSPLKSTEQTQIGNFFQNLDQLINLHQKKYDKLVILKKAMLEKMFPKPGAKVPEIRFKAFEGEWEEKRLGDIYHFQYGHFNVNPSDGGQYPVYGANGIIGGYSKYNAENSVIIGHMGEYAGSVIWCEGKHFVTYNGTISYPKSSEIIPKFGFQMLFQKDIRKICGGSGQPFLSYDTLQKINCTFPKSPDEQIKIGNYFQNLENLISLNQNQLEKLKNIKKGCLEKMFV